MIKAMKNSLDGYKTYKNIIEESGVVEKIDDELHFKFFTESFNVPVGKLTVVLTE